jgi:endonuclease-3
MSSVPDDGHLCLKALRVNDLLLGYHGEPERRERRDPLSELILTVLSQNTADVNTERSYASLRQHFATWRDVLDAPAEDVADAIRLGGLAGIKAPRIQSILRRLQDERGELNLDFLEEMPVDQAHQYLLSFKGVGPKTAACVLLFSLNKPALPVDTHVHRVTRRLGLVPLKATAEQAGVLLERLLPPDLYYPFHLNVIRHGRTVCVANRPRCSLCPLSTTCDYYRDKFGKQGQVGA